MPILAEWDNNGQSIIRITFHDNWTWEDLRDTVNDIIPMANQVEGMMHYIVDIRDKGKMPPGVFMQMRYFFMLTRKIPHLTGEVVVIGANDFTRRLYHMLQRLGYHFIVYMRFAESLECARAILLEEQEFVPVSKVAHNSYHANT